MSFEDQVDNEKVYLHAQKDMESDVLNDSITHIGNDQHTLSAGGSFVKIDAGGVHMVGAAINLNSGGSAGSGSGFSGALPESPLSAASPEYDANLEAPIVT